MSNLLVMGFLSFLMTSCSLFVDDPKNTAKTSQFVTKVADRLSREGHAEQAAHFYCETLKNTTTKTDGKASSEKTSSLFAKLLENKQYKEILHMLEGCSRIGKLNTGTKQAIATACYNEALYTKALSYLETSAVLDSKEHLNLKGLIYTALGKHTIAQQFFKKALAASPDFKKAKGNLAISYLKDKKIPEGLALLKTMSTGSEATLQDHQNYETALSLFSEKA